MNDLCEILEEFPEYIECSRRDLYCSLQNCIDECRKVYNRLAKLNEKEKDCWRIRSFYLQCKELNCSELNEKFEKLLRNFLQKSFTGFLDFTDKSALESYENGLKFAQNDSFVSNRSESKRFDSIHSSYLIIILGFFTILTLMIIVIGVSVLRNRS